MESAGTRTYGARGNRPFNIIIGSTTFAIIDIL